LRAHVSNSEPELRTPHAQITCGVESVLQVIMRAACAIVNVKVEARRRVMNNPKAPSGVLCLKCLVWLAHGSGLTTALNRAAAKRNKCKQMAPAASSAVR